MTENNDKSHSLGNTPIEAAHYEQMNALAPKLDKAFNGDARRGERKVGFILMVFPFDSDEGRCNYISNADRKDVVTMLKEQLAYFQGQPEIKGNA